MITKINAVAATLSAAGLLISGAFAQQPLSASGLSTELLAPGAWGVYMELSNNSSAPAMITGVQSPQFKSAQLVVRSRDRFQPQSALLFAAGESAELRASASHILLTDPTGEVGEATLVLSLSDGSKSRFLLNIGNSVGAAPARPAKSTSDQAAERIQAIEPKQEKRNARVISHNPVHR